MSEAERNRLDAATLRPIDVLAELVRLKDGPRDEQYRVDKERAWEQARAFLAEHVLDQPTKYQRTVRVLYELARDDADFALRLCSAMSSVFFFDEEKDRAAEIARKMRREYGAKTEKRISDAGFMFIDVYLDGVSDDCLRDFAIGIPRQAVCERRVVGTEEVEEPDYSAVPKRKVTRDIVEWDCGSLLED